MNSNFEAIPTTLSKLLLFGDTNVRFSQQSDAVSTVL